MVSPLAQVGIVAGVNLGKNLAVKLAQHAALDAVLNRIRGQNASESGSHTPEHRFSSALEELIGQGMAGLNGPVKKKVTKYNRLVGKHMRALSKARNWKNKAAKVRFKRAVALAKKELKSGIKKK